jgi:hypothetical protein
MEEIEDFLEGFNQPTYRGIRVNGVRVAVWSGVEWAGPASDDRSSWHPSFVINWRRAWQVKSRTGV